MIGAHMDGFTAHASRWRQEAETAKPKVAAVLRRCADEVDAIIANERGDAPAIVIVDGVPYPFDLAAITAEQTVWMRRDLSVSVIEMATRIAVSLAELPEVVALMALSIEQAGGQADLPSLLAQVSLSSVVDFQADDSLIAPTT